MIVKLMNNVGTRYWLELALVTILLILAGWALFTFVLPEQYPPVLPVMLAVIVAVTAAGQVVLTRLMDQKFSKFNSAFLIYKALKILILMAFMFVYSALHKEHALPFLGGTFIIYLVYMVFESRSLNRQSRKQTDR